MVIAAQADVAALGEQLTAVGELSGAVQLDAETLLSSCEALDIATNRWSAAGEMTHARMYHACVCLSG